MKTEMYVTPEMEVEEFDQEVFTENVLIPSGTSTEEGGMSTDIGGIGEGIGW